MVESPSRGCRCRGRDRCACVGACRALRVGDEDGRLRGRQLDRGRLRLLRELQSDRLYEFAWITYPELGAAVESYFGLTEREAYFLGVEANAFLDRNGDQVLCISWIGANPGIADYLISVVDNNASV
jgi:hypothetical protein